MESPPPSPTPPPLSRNFWILLIAPIVVMGLGVGIYSFGGKNTADGGLGMGLSWLSMAAMFVCSIICAVIVGKQRGAGWGILAFVGIQVLYISVSFAGCVTMLSGLNMH